MQDPDTTHQQAPGVSKITAEKVTANVLKVVKPNTNLTRRDEIAIVTALESLRLDIHRNAAEHGWHDQPRSFGEDIALVHSELSEALEEYRKNPNVLHTYEGENGKPEGVAYELADALIRLLHMSVRHGIDLAGAVLEKHEYNRSRPYRHGNKAL